MYVCGTSTYGYGATVGDARLQEPGHGHLVRFFFEHGGRGLEGPRVVSIKR
jgi:hypothetical protein